MQVFNISVHQNYTVFNYDKDTGFSLFDAYKNKTPQISEEFLKANKVISGLGDNQPEKWVDWAKSMGYADKELITFLGDVDSGKKNIKDMDTHIESASKSTSKFGKVTSTLKNVGGMIGSSLLNAGIGMLAGVAIQGVITMIDDYIHRQEKMIAKGKEAKSSIDETFAEFSKGKNTLDTLGQSFADNADDIETTGDAIDSIAKKYSELSKNVDTVTNKNKGLSSDEYQQYLDISNQLASQFPSLVEGYDSQGNAILNLGSNADSAAASLRNLYDSQMLSANVEIGNKLQDNYKGTVAQIDEYKDKIKDLQNTIDKNDKAMADMKIDADELSSSGDITLGLKSYGKNRAKAQREIAKILSDNGVAMQEAVDDAGNVTISTSGFDKNVANEIKNTLSKYKSEAIDSMSIENAEAEKSIAATELLIKEQWSKMGESLGQYLQTSDTFTKLDKSIQNAFLGNTDNINYETVSDKYGGDFMSFMYGEIIQPLSDMKPEGQKAIKDMLTLDTSSLNFDEYKNFVDKALKTAFPDDNAAQESFKKSLGFDKIIDDSEVKLEKLKDVFGSAVNELSLEDIEKGYDLVVNDKFTGTFNQLKSEIKNAKALAATGIDLEANKNFEAISAADETKNAGDDYVQAKSYLEQAKEMFDKGLIGTDDFKKRAAYFSPTGAEDAVNFAENYAKAARYLTEDASGVHNFLTDLESKGMALKTVADGTEQWTYNIEDLEQAATNMGVGFEFFMDMFGRLEDYGFSNNFVGSVEQGAKRVSDLSTELVNAKSELARLEATGADSTAIDQQREKIKGLESDLQQTQANLGQLITKSADDYAKQVEQAKTAISSLKEERDKILRENKYGENTDEVASLMEEQIRQLAQENGIELDAELKVKNKEELLEDIKNLSPEIEVKTFNSTEEMNTALNNLQANQTIKYNADVSGVESVVQAVKDENGKVTYTAEIDGVEKALKPVITADGTITYEVDNDLQSVMEKAIHGLSLPGVPVHLDAVDNATPVIDDINKKELIQKTVPLIGEDHATGIITLWNGLSANPKFTSMTAQDQATYVIGLWNSLTPEQKTAVITATDASASLTAENVTGSVESIPDESNTNIKANDNATPVISGVQSMLYGLDGSAAHTYIYTHRVTTESTVPGGGGKPNVSMPRFNGTAHAEGTANSKAGHAFSQGDWGVKEDERALVGELGAELLIRGGKFTTIGDNGAEFVNLKRGDIIFNHLQTRDLLSKGYVNSRAKVYMGGAYASGTALANGSGGGSFGVGGSGSQSFISGIGSNLNSASNNLAKAASDTSKAASDTSEAAEKLSEAVSGYTDWVEVLFQRLESQYDLLMSQMERIAHLPDKQQKLYEAMSKNSELLNRTQQAIGTYQSHFDSIVQQSGINPLIVHQIQNGSMDISKYDQDTQKIISELQSYYDKLVDCNKQYDDLLNKQSELAQTALDNIEDYIDMMTGIESSAVDYQEALRELAAAKGESAYSDNMYGSLQESIKNQQDVAGKLQSQIKSYQDEINKLMANGYMAEYSTEWFEAQAALNGFRQEAAEAEKTLIELQDQLRELDLLKLQQVIDELDRTAKRLENNSDLTESKGEQVSEKDLQAQLDNANAQIQANYNKRQELLRDQAKYDVGSDKYNEYAEEIEKLDDSIYDAMNNIEDLKNKIWEVRWQPFFDGQEALGDLIDQTDDLRGLLNSDAFLDKNGGLTVDGIANLALISQGMNAAKQQIKNYNEALKKLDEDLKNGNISTSEYKEQQKEFLDQISSSVGVVEDYKDSIVDLYTKMLEQENEVAQKSIDKQKELLDIKKKNADYNKTLRKQARDVNTLKAQIAALEGTNNASAQAELKRLKAQLRDAEEEMQDTRDDHEYDVRQNGLDGLSEDLDKQLEETLYDVTRNAEKQEQVISQMLGNIVGNYQQAYDKIQQIINSTGFVPNKDLSNNLGNLGTSNGAQDQVDNSMTNAPNYRPDDWTDVNTGQIQNGTTQDKNDQIQGDISKNPDLSNRPVAEITLSPGTLSIQEGSTGTVSATIRPNDAKNKSLQWVSSNPNVATVANGTVHAVKAGSTTISAIATDGGGATSTNSCAVTVTPKPEPPKPTTPPPSNNGGGDGVPNVGDKVIFASGDYYYSSDGQSPAGNEMRGQEVYITSVNNANWAQKKYHISRTPRFGERDLGWVSLDQLRGYASGTKKFVNGSEIVRINEGNNPEMMVRRGALTGTATTITYGDAVVNARLSKNIMDLGEHKDDIYSSLNIANSLGERPNVTNNYYDKMIEVQGSIDKETYPGMKKVIEGVTKEFTKEAKRAGVHRSF